MPKRIAATRCRELLQAVAREERSGGDGPEIQRKDMDAGDVFGQPAVLLDGKGKANTRTSGSRSRKRAAPDVSSSSKRPCTIGSRSRVKRSQH